MDSELWRKAYPGDVLHVLRHGDPIEVYLFETPSNSTTGLWTYSGYASDSWRLNSRATLNLGVRFDRYRVFLPRQQHPAGRFNATPQTFPAVDVIAWNVLVPRLGAVYRLAGDGRTVAKLSCGLGTADDGPVLGGYSLRDEFLGLPQANIVRNVPRGGRSLLDLGPERDEALRCSMVALSGVRAHLESRPGKWIRGSDRQEQCVPADAE